MKRYYLSDIIGDGTEENPFRPAVADLGVAWSGSIPTDPDTGKPLKTWALVIVSAANHAALRADNRIAALPDFPLDGKVSAINTTTKNGMLNALTKRGIDTSFVGNADGYRDVIRGVGRAADPVFDENNFDVT